MPDALSSEEIEGLRESASKLIYRERVDIKNNTLHHYTNVDGLLGILTSQTIWLSNIKFTNDQTEMVDGFSVIRSVSADVIDGYINRGSEDKALELYKRVKADVQKICDEYSYLAHSIYVFSLSEEEDLLSQWRGYADNGSGAVISLSVERTPLVEKAAEDIYLTPVIYNDEYKRGICGKIIKTYLDKISHREIPRGEYDVFVSALATSLVLFAISCKSDVFQEEKEWRLVHILSGPGDAERVMFRRSGDVIRPYVVIPCQVDTREWPKHCSHKGAPSCPKHGCGSSAGSAEVCHFPQLAGVCLGQGTKQDSLKRAIQVLASTKFGGGDIPVEHHQTPFQA